jgi:hydrogenase maturation factor
LRLESRVVVVEIDRREVRASLCLVDSVQPGDWVIVAAGTILERLEESEANEIRELLDRAAAVS